MPKALQIGLIVLGGLVFAFLAGYILFSYFSQDNQPAETQQANTAPVEVESDSEGISQESGDVAGVSSDSTGVSSTSEDTPTPVTYETPDSEGIQETNETPETTTITPEMHEEAMEESQDQDDDDIVYVEADDGNDDSEVTSNQSPEVNEETDYIEYIYTFFFNDDALDRYEEGFDYYIDGQTCDDSDYFTSSSYDFSGTIYSDDMDDEVDIRVRIKEEYIDDADDFDDSEYKLDGELYIVEGDINVPVCED